MTVIVAPEGLGASAGWMRQAFLVAALAEAGEEGAEPAVPGASLWVSAKGSAPLVLVV